MRIRRGKTTVLMMGAFAVSLSAIVIACSDSKPPATGGGGTTDAGAGVDHQAGEVGDQDSGLVFNPPDAADGAVVCPTPAFGGATVNARVVGGAPPGDTGGTVVPGTYDLTDVLLYDETTAEDDGGIDSGLGTGVRARATIVLTSDMMQLAQTAESPATGGTPISTSFVAKQHVSDVFLVLDDTCPGTDSRQIPFTATPTTITLHSAMVRREIYTLRP
jgi:hypothetical protein